MISINVHPGYIYRVDLNLARINKALHPFFTEMPYTEGTVLCMRILGSAVQNNLQAQVKAAERNYVSAIIDILRKCPSSNEQVVSTALYALSCLVRQYPVAQIEFVSAGGPILLVKMIGGNHSIRNQLKATRLLGDLITEEADVESTYGNKTENVAPDGNATGDGSGENTPSLSAEIRNQTDINRLGLYRRAHVRKTLLDLGWCDILCRFLEGNSVPDIEAKGDDPMNWGENDVNHELVQIVASSMISLTNHCQLSVSRAHVLALYDYYNMLARVDSDYDELRTALYDLRKCLQIPRTIQY